MKSCCWYLFLINTHNLILYYEPMWTCPQSISSQFSLQMLRSLNSSLFILYCSFIMSCNLIHKRIRFDGIGCIRVRPDFILISVEKRVTWLAVCLFCLFCSFQRYVSFMAVLRLHVYFWYACREQHRSHMLFHSLLQYIRTIFEFLNFFFCEFYWVTLIISFKYSWF